MNQMEALKCLKCNEELCYARDTDGDLVDFKTVCVCGHKSVFQFIGYPRLRANDKYSFNFTDEEEITCQKR